MKSEEQQLFANHSLSSIFTKQQKVSCRLTERNNPFLYYQVSNQICPKEIPEIENQEMPFDDGTINEQISQHYVSNPIYSTERKSQILQFNYDEPRQQPYERQSHYVAEVDDQKNFLQLIRRKKILQKFVSNTKQKAYIFPQFLTEQFKKLQFEQYFLKNKQFQKLDINQEKKQVSKLNFIPLFQPQQPFIIFWELLIFIQILYISWWGPFTIVFENHQHTNTVIENIIIYFGVFDIFMTMNKSIIFQGQILDDRKAILKLYVKQQLIIDVVSLINISLIDNRIYGADQEVVYFFLAILLLYINQMRLRAILDQIQESFDVQEDALDLIKVLLIIGYFAHISACIWARVSMLTELKGYSNWIEYYDVENQSIWIKYNFSFYWATMTMVTVGYGDITPQNPYEMLCAILIMIIASIIFGYSLNSIGMIVKNINDKQQKYRKSQLLINSYMNKNQVSLQLQCKVRNYLKFYIEQDNLQNDEELNSLISKLSPALKEELLYDIQKKPLKSMNFFIQQISQDAQKQIAYHLQPQHFTPQDIIYQRNSTDDYALYLIVEGRVAMIDERNNAVVHTYEKGECFGQYEFFTGINRELQARSLDFTHVYILKRDVILNILEEYAEDRQKFNNIKDQMILMKNFEIINLGCYFCKEFNHYYTECPYLQYKPDLEKLIKQEGFFIQNRSRYFRDRIKSGAAYHLLTYKKEQHEKFLSEIGIEQESSSSSEKEQSQQLSNQQSNSIEKKDELQSSQHKIFLQTQNLESKPLNSMMEQVQLKRKKKRDNSLHTHTHQIGSQNLKTMQMDYEKEYTHISRRKRSQSIKDTTQKNKRRNSQDSQGGGGSNQNRITLSINNTTRQFNSNPSPSIRSILELQQQDFVKLTEEMDQQNLQFLNCDMERSYQYKYYFPQNNLSQVLLQYQRQQKQNKFKGRSDSNRYSIFYDVKRKLSRPQKQHKGSKIYSPSQKRIINKIPKRSFVISPSQ